MKNQYTITVRVEFPDYTGSVVTAFNVDAFAAEEIHKWSPIDVTDAPLGFAFGGVSHEEAKRINRDREQLAKDISERLTAAIMEGLKSRDLANGYKKEDVAR